MAPLKRLSRKAWALALLSVLLATLAAEGLYRSGWAVAAEHWYSDLWHRLAGQRWVPRHVAVVMVDDPSLTAHPDDPLVFWTPLFARAIGTLKAVGVPVVALDYQFSVSPERWLEKLGNGTRDFDRTFRSRINQGGVLLAANRVRDGSSMDDFILPHPDYLLALPDYDLARFVGLANLRTDADGAIRHFVFSEVDSDWVRQEGLPNLAFGALAALQRTGQDPLAGPWRFGGLTFGPGDGGVIAFAGPPGTFRPLSFERLLAPGAESDPDVRALAGKVVFIGAGYAGVNDVHATPYSTTLAAAQRLMPGPEIQANIVETLLSGRFMVAVSGPARLLAFVAGFSLLAFLGVRLKVWWSLLLAVGIASAGGAAAYLLFGHDLLFPVVHLQLGLVVVLAGLTLLRLTREERERARIGALFGRYVSGQVMSALMASPELPELGGKATRITVLFTDIRNFTTISERLAAREVVEMLNTYFERACAALLKEGATIDKFIGDAIMAEFGAPLPRPDDALRALRAAVALRVVAVEFREWVNTRFADRGLPEFDVGIGIHTGEAVVGNVGSSARMEYTAIGDTVNLASRLEGMTKITGCAILASVDTVRAAGPAVHTGARHVLTVKGRSQPVETFEILSAG
jgi:class 3 adenylate cyclase/CHASE2 domain-containing sensor protein